MEEKEKKVSTRKNKKSMHKNIFKTIGKYIIHPNLISLIVVAVIAGGACFYMGTISKPKQDHEETVTKLSLKDIGTLATQEAYVTVVETMDNNREFFSTQVPLTNSVCIFSHDFEITAGYDFEKIVPQIEPKTGNKKGTITISLPKAKILSNGMVPDKEHVYYEKESIFNNLSEKKKPNYVRKWVNKPKTQPLKMAC